MKPETRTLHVPDFGEIEVPPHVSRVDSGPKTSKGWHGWQVRWTEGGVRRSKWFPDAAHGGIERALEAAIEHRHRHYPGREPRSTLREDRGVTLVEKLHSNGRTVQLYAQASHPQHGRTAVRIYAGTKATATPERIERAMEQAWEARRRLVEEHRRKGPEKTG